MKIAIYIDILTEEYEKYHIKKYLINSIKHILTDIDATVSLIESPIVYKDELSTETIIKE